MQDKITLEELAPYLPYGLKIKCTIDNSIGSIFSISSHQYICKGLFDLKNGTDKREFVGVDFNNYTNLASPKNFIPLVRPLSQLTQGILRSAGWTSHVDFMTIEINTWKRKGTFPNALPYEKMLWLIKNHYDVHNWIERGLALPIED